MKFLLYIELFIKINEGANKLKTDKKDMKKNQEKLWNGRYIFMLFLGTLTSTSFFMVAPTLSKYAIQLGATLPVAGVIAGLFSITALVARPFGGIAADRLNKKLVLIIATITMGIAAIGYSLSTNIPMFVAFRVLHGIAFAVSGTTNIAFVASFIPKERLGEGIGYLGLGQILSTAVGPNIGLLIGNTYGFNNTFLISGIILLVAAVLMTRITYQPIVKIAKTGEKLPRKRIVLQDLIATQVLPLAMIGGIFSLSNGIVSSFLVLIGEERGIKNIALYFTVNAICLFMVRPMAGKLADKSKLSYILYPALFLAGMEALVLGRATSLWMILAAAVLKSFGQGSAQPTLQSHCVKMLGPSKSGVATSTFFIGADIGQGLGPIIGGVISASFGYNVMFYIVAGIFVVGMAAYTLYERNYRKTQEESLQVYNMERSN